MAYQFKYDSIHGRYKNKVRRAAPLHADLCSFALCRRGHRSPLHGKVLSLFVSAHEPAGCA